MGGKARGGLSSAEQMQNRGSFCGDIQASDNRFSLWHYLATGAEPAPPSATREIGYFEDAKGGVSA